MNPIIATLILFSSIFLLVFVMPVISLIGFTIILGEADLTPIIIEAYPPYPSLSLKKVIHKGKAIWVDA